MNEGENYTVLHYASEMSGGHVGVVENLIRHKADINTLTANHETPVFLAAGLARTPAITFYLMDKGGDVNVVDKDGDTPLHNAAKNYRAFEIVKRLVDNGYNVNVQNNKKATPLHLAIDVQKNMNTVAYLLDKGASINAQNADGEYPIHIAADTTVQMIGYLLERGANIESKTKESSTPFLKSLDRNKLQIAQFLSGKGANVFATDKFNNNAIHIAADALYDNPETIKWLVSLGITYWKKNKAKKPMTPIELAEKRDKPQVVAYLKSLPPKKS